MEEQFVPYELAVKLKELGFDLRCLAYYDTSSKFYPMGTVVNLYEIHFGVFIPKYQYVDGLEVLFAAPLWQQAEEWFRNRGYESKIEWLYEKSKGYSYYIASPEDGTNIPTFARYDFKTYGEARLACLEKLIELCQK